MLNVTKKAEADAITLVLEGRLDTNTAPLLEEDLKGIAESTALVLDFENLEYISSAGLRVLLSAERRMKDKGGMTLIHVAEAVMDVFEVTGFADILDIR